jgi:hypothetical protein
MSIADMVRMGWIYDPVRDHLSVGGIVVSGEMIRKDGGAALSLLYRTRKPEPEEEDDYWD